MAYRSEKMTPLAVADEAFLPLFCPFLHFQLTPQCIAFRAMVLVKDERYRQSTASVLGTFAVLVSLDTLLQIDADPSVKRAVRAAKQVEVIGLVHT